MGERKKRALRVQFDRSVKLEFHGAKITSDGGILVYRELDEVLGLMAMTEEVLHDKRRGKNKQHTLTALMRQATYGRLAGYEDTNDVERLRVDPTMRRVVGGRAKKRLAASVSEMGRFETELLTSNRNFRALTDLSGMWIDQVHARTGLKELILDMDSSESPTPAGRGQGGVALR